MECVKFQWWRLTFVPSKQPSFKKYRLSLSLTKPKCHFLASHYYFKEQKSHIKSALCGMLPRSAHSQPLLQWHQDERPQKPCCFQPCLCLEAVRATKSHSSSLHVNETGSPLSLKGLIVWPHCHGFISGIGVRQMPQEEMKNHWNF